MMGLRAAGYQGAGSILSAALRDFAERCAPAFADTACQVELDVTASGETARSLFDSVQQGNRDVAYMASGYLSAQVPELAVLDLPFSVDDRRAALAALDGDAGAQLQAAVAARTSLRVLGIWDNGFRHVSNWRQPLCTPEDCEGLVIRTLDSALYRESLGALGFVPVTSDVRELVRVVAEREVDAQENPLTNLVNFKLWHHHPHVSLTGHCFGVALLVCHARWFECLPPAVRQAVQAAARAASLSQREAAAAEDSKALAFLVAQGVQVVTARDIARDAMRARCAEVTARACRDLPPALVRAYLAC